MTHEAIVTELSLRLARIEANPTEIVFAISTLNILSAIAKRMGDKALTLKTTELLQARATVRAAIALYDPDDRNYINIGLDAWETARAAGPCDPSTTPTRSVRICQTTR